VEERVMMLEQRTEQQERETSSIKVNVSELELQLQASLASTHNGSFLWRIPDVARRRRDAIDERITSIYSPPFYTGRNGYKMCIRAYLNGDGIGYKTHFSVFFVLMRGEFDPLLKWPFEYKVSLILVDQEHRKHIVQTFKPTPESSSFRRPQSDMNIASGCPQFSKLSVLDDESYTKDDVIYLKCIVDTSRIFHP
jgi:TNF receptor-associated factor 2/TNF receptor-associated factor 3